MADLPPDLEQLFRELGEREGGIRPAPLSQSYLHALREIEELPCNQERQDKSWVLRADRRWHETFKNVRRLS